MHDGVWPDFQQDRDEPVVLGRQVHVHEADLAAGDFLPCGQPLSKGPDRREGVDFQLDVDLPAAQVVGDGDVVTTIGQVERRGPTAESVAAEDQNAHRCSKSLLNRSINVGPAHSAAGAKPRARPSAAAPVAVYRAIFTAMLSSSPPI